MQLNLKRTIQGPEAVIGQLAVNGEFECYTLEDPDGAGDRIDAGTYEVITDYSNRFKKIMPLVVGSAAVNGRGIRIHAGNTQADTSGCILVGRTCTETSIGESRLAFSALFAKIEDAIARGETVTLEVSDGTRKIGFQTSQ